MSYLCAPPFAHTAGPRDARIVLVGEAWGEREEALGGQPFAGESGKELFRMLGEALPDTEPGLHQQVCDQMRFGDSWVSCRGKWLAAASILLTNVLTLRPPGNNLEALCVSKKESTGTGVLALPVVRGKYLSPDYAPEITRLRDELSSCNPKVIVGLGNTALWALAGCTNIGMVRGSVTLGAEVGVAPGTKILPTYHPAAVLRQWAWRPIVVTDLLKAARESKFPELRRPSRRVLVDPTLVEVQAWVRSTLEPGRYHWLSPDIETAFGQITCIGFARSISEALVVPFVDKRAADWSYWKSPGEERQAWDAVALLLQSPIPKLGQNFIYDLQYITRMGIRPRNCLHDTMLLHHSLFPEMQKGLGFLGSVYTNEQSWKLLRRRKADTEKKDE